MAQLTQIHFNEGDPVTAETLQKVVENINLVNLGDNPTDIQLVNAGTVGSASGSAKLAAKTITAKSTRTIKPGTGDWTWTFPAGYEFTEDPVISIALQIPVANIANAHYFPVVTSISTTGIKYRVVSAASNTPAIAGVIVHLTASGNFPQ